MQIKDNAELSNILSMAFSAYANKVQNGLTYPFQDFLTGKDSIDMKVSLKADGSIHLNPIIQEVEAIMPIKEDVPPVLEAQSEPETSEFVEVLDQKALEENKVVITKRKRKTE
jgi:hypothetical protein